MNVALTIVLTVQMLSALGMIGLILVQHGKGADMGAAFHPLMRGCSLFQSKTAIHHRCNPPLFQKRPYVLQQALGNPRFCQIRLRAQRAAG